MELCWQKSHMEKASKDTGAKEKRPSVGEREGDVSKAKKEDDTCIFREVKRDIQENRLSLRWKLKDESKGQRYRQTQTYGRHGWLSERVHSSSQ